MRIKAMSRGRFFGTMATGTDHGSSLLALPVRPDAKAG